MANQPSSDEPSWANPDAVNIPSAVGDTLTHGADGPPQNAAGSPPSEKRG